MIGNKKLGTKAALLNGKVAWLVQGWESKVRSVERRAGNAPHRVGM